MLHFSWLSRIALNSSKYAHFILRLSDSIRFGYFSFNTICIAFDILIWCACICTHKYIYIYRHRFITTLHTHHNNVCLFQLTLLISFHSFVYDFPIRFSSVSYTSLSHVRLSLSPNRIFINFASSWSEERTDRNWQRVCVPACLPACIVCVCLFVRSKNNNTLNFRFMFRLRSTSALFCSHIEIFDWQFFVSSAAAPAATAAIVIVVVVLVVAFRAKVYKILRNIRTKLKRLLPFCKTFCTRCTCKI